MSDLASLGVVETLVNQEVLLHRGRPAHEYRDLVAGCAVAPLPWQMLTVTGPDRLSWLHALTSQHLTALAPGVSAEALLLTAQGRITAALALVDDGATTHILLEASAADTVAEHLEKMRFALRVDVARTDARIVGVIGEQLPAGTADVIWHDPWPLAPGGTTYTLPGVEPPALDLSVAAISDVTWAELVQADAIAGWWAWEACRIESWRPSWSAEVDARAIPPELDWLRTAVHLNKGCYCGQETIARVVNLGRPPRRLTFLHLDGSADHLPARGTPVQWREKPVGTLTSAVRHPELGPVGLALLKRSVPADAALVVDGVAASQEIIVNPEGVSAARPSQPVGQELRQARFLRHPPQ
ncbi:MAG: folate-binding protein [Bowdeniella nasicola]|nr:folate-binding protein [Bowdeniella nasicola]